jgi:4-amino-4-deoxy-L-arabinose transferase-like glycosyltransferase
MNKYLPILTILLISAALRIHALGQDVRFHPDEALYTNFARTAVVHGEWWLPGPLDKPPLSIYLSGISIHLFASHTIGYQVVDVDLRAGEFAARLPNIYVSMMLVALTYALSKSLFRREDPMWSSGTSVYIPPLIIALSPYMIVFSASAFTDLLMVTLGVAALVAANRRKDPAWSSAWSGVFLALSIASKPQGIFFVPLAIVVMWATHNLSWRRLLRLSTTLVIGMVILFYWDGLRPETSIFALADANYVMEQTIASPGEWWPRLLEWLEYGQWLLGPGLITVILVIFGLSAAVIRRQRIDLVLAGFVMVYWLVHWLGGFNIYDRYLLPLVPVLALLAGRGTPIIRRQDTMWSFTTPIHVITTFSVLWMALIAYMAAGWHIDLGRDHYPLDREGEIIMLADYLNDKPLGAIIYDRWLGWEMGYYLGAWSDKRHVHYPTEQALAEDALQNPDTAPRYFIARTDTDVMSWLDTLQNAGFLVVEDYRTEAFISYQLLPPLEVGGASNDE